MATSEFPLASTQAEAATTLQERARAELEGRVEAGVHRRWQLAELVGSPEARTIVRPLGLTSAIVIAAMIGVLASACSEGDNGSGGSEATAEPATVGGSGDELPQPETYSLSYTSTCGDGPYITFGTSIQVDGDAVVVTAGEAPMQVGSFARWQELIDDARANGRLVEVDNGVGGWPVHIQIGAPDELDNQFCVDISSVAVGTTGT